MLSSVLLISTWLGRLQRAFKLPQQTLPSSWGPGVSATVYPNLLDSAYAATEDENELLSKNKQALKKVWFMGIEPEKFSSYQTLRVCLVSIMEEPIGGCHGFCQVKSTI